MHAPMHCFKNVTSYFAMALGYICKMLMKLKPGAYVIKLFTTHSMVTPSPMNCFKNVTSYFAMAIGWAHKMVMILTPEALS
jgi:hypothetical protein